MCGTVLASKAILSENWGSISLSRCSAICAWYARGKSADFISMAMRRVDGAL